MISFDKEEVFRGLHEKFNEIDEFLTNVGLPPVVDFDQDEIDDEELLKLYEWLNEVNNVILENMD